MKKRKRKGWSVRDVDHVSVGSQVLLKRKAKEIHPSIGFVHRALGVDSNCDSLLGRIEHRYYGSGSYMVQIEGSKLSINVERDDFFYPVPADVIPISRARKVE